ncbi:MAG: GNAT family N-acetyltransferase [Actinomycetia bacterium]|nr:GNAT family N-acetyltransferase [Actinomycetes bacterium]
MSPPDEPFISTPLTKQHDVTDFTCGAAASDRWLRNEAWRAQVAGTARTRVWLSGESVVAYYAICPTSLQSDELPRSVGAGYSVLPAYLLARLALACELQGQHLGGQLLIDALERLDAATTRFAGRLIVVDAMAESVVPFYERYGFRRVGATNRLYLTAASLHALMPGGTP